MFDRETKREKILEVRNRELRLKQKTKASRTNVQEEEEVASGGTKSEEDLFKDKHVEAAEDEFFEVIRKETKVPEPEIPDMEALMEEAPIEEPVPEPEPAPPPTPAEPEKKKKGKKKKK